MAICNHLSLGANIFEFVVIADNGIIYCNPFGDNKGILTIDTNTDPVTELDTNLSDWDSHADALDECVYFMPYFANHKYIETRYIK